MEWLREQAHLSPCPTSKSSSFPADFGAHETMVRSADLGAESWPGVTTKSMFGFLSFYRRGTIFAALPQSRGFASPSLLILKFNPMLPALLKLAQANFRLDTNTRAPGKGWFSFRLTSEEGLRDALVRLNHAYEAAGKGRTR